MPGFEVFWSCGNFADSARNGLHTIWTRGGRRKGWDSTSAIEYRVDLSRKIGAKNTLNTGD